MRNGTTQVERMLNYIEKTGSISQREAYLEFNVQAFTRRIADIREMGIKLRREDQVNPVTGQKYGRYFFDTSAE